MDDIRRTIVDLLILGRFQFLFGGLLLYILGAMVAIEMGCPAETLRLVLGYLVFAPAHLSVSYSNDIYDVDADRFNPKSAFTGGSGVLERRPELRLYALIIAISLILVSIMGSIAFVIYYSMTPAYIAFVIFGSLLGWFYTAPPLKLSYRGLGEISTALTVGLLVPLFGFFTMSGSFDPDLLYFLFPMSLSGIVFILIVQTPDLEADREGGKRTWVLKLGRRPTFVILFVSILLQSLYYGFLYMLRVDPGGLSFLPFFVVSLIPLLLAIPGFLRRPARRKEATKFVTLNMVALFLYLGILDALFIFLI